MLLFWGLDFGGLGSPLSFPGLQYNGLAQAETSSQTGIKIMPLGDSITFGTPDPSYGGYRRLLQILLLKDGYRVDFVGSQKSRQAPAAIQDNEGHSGWTIRQLKNGIDSNGWLEIYQPDIILLHIGTNDIGLGYASSLSDQLSGLLDDILRRLPKVRVIVAQIIPFRQGPEVGHQSYNVAIPAIVASKGPRVSRVDMRNILSKSDFADDLHPNADGYNKMAQSWEPAIRAVLPVFNHKAPKRIPSGPTTEGRANP